MDRPKVKQDQIRIDAYISHGVRLCRVAGFSPNGCVWLEDAYTERTFQATRSIIIANYVLVREAPVAKV